MPAEETRATSGFRVTDLEPPNEASPPDAEAVASDAGPPRRPRRRLRTLGSYALLTAGGIIILFPIYVTVVNSLLPPDQLVHQPPPLFPTHPQWGHYVTAWTSGSMSKYM